MAVRRLADEQPADFAFTPENLEWAKAKIAEYPEGRAHSAVLPLLWRAQEQHERWLPEPAIRYVADMIDMPYIRALEVATFYTMFQLKPVGRTAHVQVCGTTPCLLRGADKLIAICRKRIAAAPLELSADGAFSWEEVECAGACVNAPMAQVGADTFEDLTAETFEALLDGLAAGRPPQPGPQNGRRSSEPLGGLTSLTSDPEELFRAREGRPQEAEAEAGPDALPEAGLDPATPAARREDRGRPSGRDRPKVEAARSGGDGKPPSPQEAAPVAPEPKTNGTVEAAPDALEKQKHAGDNVAARSSVIEGSDRETPDEAAKAPAAPDAEPATAGAADAKPAAAGVAEADAEPVTAGVADAKPVSEDAAEELSPRDRRERSAIERADSAGRRPDAAASDDRRDNLQEISGIGPVLEKRLHSLGVLTFAQIAAWSEENIAWVDSYLAFKGRIERERWVEQARGLSAREGGGEDT
jgi:NADH-quinone oxidoreductase subunit E